MTRAAPGRRHATPGRQRPAQGLGAVAVIVVLVAMAAMAAALLRLSQQGSTTSQQDVLGTRAGAAARSGLEWGLYQALKGSWTTCSSASQTLDLRTDSGMWVTVSCDSRQYNEGESAPGTPQTVRLFTINAVACNGATNCPDASAAVKQGYVERQRQAQAVN